jgi:16S rRNA (guanine1516-N2)-methyltransferase
VNKLYITNENLLQDAQLLAAFTNQFAICTDVPEEDVFLRLDEEGLAIITQQFQPLYVHDIYNKVYLRKDNLSRELLIQAIKIKPTPDILIIDATAGFAKDSVLLGLYGYKVLMLEQNPILATIVHYAMNNRIIPAENLQLIFTNSLNYFKTNPNIHSYAIYLDPMFKKQDKALAKKDMQIIQLLTKDDTNLDTELFKLAYPLCKKLIVKRDNKQAILVPAPLPTYSKQGKTIRYDVYVNNS